jgi:hypothetical protein
LLQTRTLWLPAPHTLGVGASDCVGATGLPVAAALGGSLVLTGLGAAERNALLDLWQRKKHGKTVQRIAKIKTVLNEHDRISSLLSGWSLSLFAKEADAIAEAQESERAAKEALADVG